MRFEWDDQKNASNRIKHGVRFETATAAFDDPWLLMERDYLSDGEARWRTIGEVNGRFLLLVIHLLDEDEESNEEVVRIISAREATPQERRRYERSV